MIIRYLDPWGKLQAQTSLNLEPHLPSPQIVTQTPTHKHMQMKMCIHKCLYMCTYVCMYVCVYICV